MLKGRLGLDSADIPHTDRYGVLWLDRGAYTPRTVRSISPQQVMSPSLPETMRCRSKCSRACCWARERR